MGSAVDPLLETAIAAARQAGALLRAHWERGVAVEHKSDIDLVTAADRESEALILSILKARFPDHGFLAEESGQSGDASSHVWVIDPLDGTTNFAHRYPQFSVTLALRIDDRTELGVAYDPMHDELYAARRGQGAFLNGRPLDVSPTPTLARALLATGFPYDRQTSAHNNIRQHSAFLLRAQGVLRAGSAALDLAAVSCGRLDGFWEFKLSPWDMAAGALLVEAAGGRVTDGDGGPLDLHSPGIVASNGRIHAEMLEVLR